MIAFRSTAAPVAASGLAWAGYLLGVSLGGFFDGILLHQILQWHHLLSAVEAPQVQSLEIQLLADGLFHALMYVVAAGSLWLLWKSRRSWIQPHADRLLLANAFIGFGTWHVLDGILSHWILGIHRIRMDAAAPLLWDLIWFVVFGVAFVAIGLWMRKRKGGGDGESPRKRATALMLACSVAIAGPVAALPPADMTTVMVFFKPGTGTARVFDAIDAVDGRILWASSSGHMWAIRVGEDMPTRSLYANGAYMVSRSALLAGCLAWTRVRS